MGSSLPHHGELIRFLAQRWNIEVVSVRRLAVGFPDNHHYVVESGDARFFVTVDDLCKRRLASDPEAAFDLLERASQSAYMLRHDRKLEFVLAPVLDREGTSTARFDKNTAVTVFPFVEGSSSSDGEYGSPEQRRSVLGCLGRLHATSVSVPVTADTLRIPLRAELEQALEYLDCRWDTGPYSEMTRRRLFRSANLVADHLDLYDLLKGFVADDTSGWVVTHGEPHGANVHNTPDARILLVDWDTIATAPRERDLWMILQPGDKRDWAAYTSAAPSPSPCQKAMDLYRLWWELSEIAEYVDRFRNPHDNSTANRYAWEDLKQYLPDGPE
jgi:spectinomycin phosphotransferase